MPGPSVPGVEKKSAVAHGNHLLGDLADFPRPGLPLYWAFGGRTVASTINGVVMQHATTAAECGTHTEFAIAGRLEQIQRVIEDKFCDAGEVLQRSLDGINDLIGSLDNLATAFDGKTAVATAADLTVAAAKLCTLPACHARHHDAVMRLSRSREKLARHISIMRCSLSFMAAFVRSAETMTEVAGMGRFAAAVAACVNESESELDTLELELTVLQRELGRATVQGELLGQQIAEQLPAVPEELSAAAAFVSNHYDQVAATAIKVSAIARDIRQRVFRILEALQFGDITRQRIEHIQALLAEAEAEAAWQTGEAQHRLRATCYSLVAMHMAEIDADFDREIVEIEDNMNKLADDAGALLKLHELAFDHDGGRNCGFLHALSIRIDAAGQLIAAIAATDRSAVNTGRSTIETAHKLGVHIDRIQALRNEMHGLAAPAETDKTSLSVATNEVREHCHVLEEAARVGLVTLDKLLHLTSAVAGNDGHTEQPQDSKAVAAATALNVASERIRDVREKTESGISEIAAKGDAVVAMLSLSGERLKLHHEIGEVLSSVAKQAARLSKDAYTAGDEVPAAMTDLLSGFCKHYTMAHERDVHHELLEKLIISDSEPVSAISESDDVLF